MDDDHDDNFRPMFPHKSSPYDLNSKIMLTAIISLMIVVVLVVILHIYARCVLGRRTRRRAARHGLSLRVARFHSAGQQPPKAGLDSTVIATLPVFKFKGARAGAGSREGDGEEPVGPECAVCLSFLEDEEMVRLLPNCSHIFHAECIDKWFGSHTTCPICRTEAKPQLQPDPREPPSLAMAQPPPPLDRINSTLYCIEGTSDGSAQTLSKSVVGSSSRFNSFRRMLTRERSSQRIQSRGLEDDVEDIESQAVINQPS